VAQSVKIDAGLLVHLEVNLRDFPKSAVNEDLQRCSEKKEISNDHPTYAHTSVSDEGDDNVTVISLPAAVSIAAFE